MEELGREAVVVDNVVAEGEQEEKEAEGNDAVEEDGGGDEDGTIRTEEEGRTDDGDVISIIVFFESRESATNWDCSAFSERVFSDRLQEGESDVETSDEFKTASLFDRSDREGDGWDGNWSYGYRSDGDGLDGDQVPSAVQDRRWDEKEDDDMI